LVALLPKDPEITASRIFTISGAFIEHPETESGDRTVSYDIDAFITFLVLDNSSIRAKFDVASDKSISAANGPLEPWEGHRDFRMKVVQHGQRMPFTPSGIY